MPLTPFAIMTAIVVTLAQAVLFRGADLSVLGPQLLAMAAIGTCLFASALARPRRTSSAAT